MAILVIIGNSRSGSTVLQHLLALQSGVAAVGELRRFGDLARAGEVCACGEVLSACPFWCAVCADRPPERRVTLAPRVGLRWHVGVLRTLAALRNGSPPAGRRFRARDHAAAEECIDLHRRVAAVTGAVLSVDSSKEPDHYLHLSVSFPGQVDPLFLHRDGRGIVWSKVKRAGLSVKEAIDGYVWMERLVERVRRASARGSSADLRYEDLCRSPRVHLERILAPYEVDVASVDLSDLGPERHDVGGSPHFAGTVPSSVRLDECWRDEMPADVLAEFERRAGAFNRRRGYTD
ncbi:MAG: hypothetical protein CMJ84_10395 [Planctomycetes bacterium]|jgi:hypothetical protein|nr:hypothetical protein [Planctomycetota bacterium]MDP6409388.1 hypothetical protein [Planctomycetota bacterium]